MEIYKVLLDYWGLLVPLSTLIFIKKNFYNTLSIFLLSLILVFPKDLKEFQIYIALFVVALIIPKEKSKLDETISRFVSAICLVAFLILNSEESLKIDEIYFLILVSSILLSIKGFKRKLLTIASVSMPIVTTVLSIPTKVLLVIPFLFLPLLFERLSKKEFSTYCLGCLISLGSFTSEPILSTYVGFAILSIFVVSPNGEKALSEDEI